jgi:hypothetical protein
LGQASYEVLDGIPIPVMRRCRGERHRLFADEVGMGCGGSDRDWYYGAKLLVAVVPAGIITGFLLAPAGTEERWDAEALLRWRTDPAAAAPTATELAPILGAAHRRKGQRLGPTGPLRAALTVGQAPGVTYLADTGLRGVTWQAHWTDAYTALVVTPPPVDPTDATSKVRRRTFQSLRQVVETTGAVLTDVFGLKFPRARTAWGLLTRLAAKIAAYDLALGLNHLFHRPTFAIVNPLV